jgi:hypothetical protein
VSGRVEISEADLREFMEAAEEVRHEGGTRLYPSTEDRFERALDALKFDLAKERP